MPPKSKKRLIVILATALALISICGYCFIAGSSFVYTNLADSSSRELARSLLTEAELPEKNITRLLGLIFPAFEMRPGW